MAIAIKILSVNELRELTKKSLPIEKNQLQIVVQSHGVNYGVIGSKKFSGEQGNKKITFMPISKFTKQFCSISSQPIRITHYNRPFLTYIPIDKIKTETRNNILTFMEEDESEN